MKHFFIVLFLCVLAFPGAPAGTASLRSLHRIYLENLDPAFQEYLRLEFTRQFRGEVLVVLDRKLADAVLTGRTESQSGAMARTGRHLGLDMANLGTVDLLDRDRRVVLWTEQAGDRGVPVGEAGKRLVAERLVKKLKRAMK